MLYHSEILLTWVHSVSLKVRSLHWIGADGNDPETSGQIPNNLRYGKELSRTEDIDMSDAEPSGTHSMSTPPSKPELTPGHNPLQTEDIGYHGLRSHHKQSAEKSSRISNSAEDARRRQDEDTNEMLRRMVPVCFPLL
jgi:hypothetical protein